jgi:pullulanase/glycogen debranching enzyme
MVKALHNADIGVVLDVVYNHTSEGDQNGPVYSYKGFDGPGYYMRSSDPASPYANYSGTGNTLNFGQPHVRKLVMDSLRYWRRKCTSMASASISLQFSAATPMALSIAEMRPSSTNLPPIRS